MKIIFKLYYVLELSRITQLQINHNFLEILLIELKQNRTIFNYSILN